MANVGTAYVTIAPTMKGFSSSVSSALNGQAGSLGASASSSFSSKFQSTGTSKIGAVMGAVAGVAGTVATTAFNAIGSSMGAAISRVDQLNNFPKVMQNLGYSSDDASRSIQKMSNAIDGLPTSLDTLSGMTQQLAPLCSNLDEATDISIALNNAMLAGGKSSEDVSRAMTQYTQALSKGKPDLMDWRTLQEVMPGQLNQIAQAMLGAGKNSNDLYTELKNGTVSMTDFNNAVLKLNSEGIDGFASFEQQARDATQGIGTALSNVQNRLAKAGETLINAFGATRISGAINGVTSSFGKIANTIAPAFTLAGNICESFVNYMQTNFLYSFQLVAQAIKNIWNALTNNLNLGESKEKWIQLGETISKNFVPKLNEALQFVSENADKFAVAVEAMIGAWVAFQATTTATKWVSAISSGVTTAVNAFNRMRVQLSLTSAMVGKTQTANLAMGQGISSLGGKIKSIPLSTWVAGLTLVGVGVSQFLTKTESGQQILGSLKSAGDTAFEGLKNGASNAFNAFSNAIGLAGNGITSFAETISNGITNLAGNIAPKLESLGSTIGSLLGNAFNTVAPAWESLGTALSAYYPLLAEQATNFINNIGNVFTQLQPLFATIGSVIGDTLVTLAPTFATLMNSFNQLRDTFISMLPELSAAFVPVIQQIGTSIQTLAPVFGQLISSLANMATTLMPTILSIATWFLSFIPTVLSFVTQLVQTLLPVAVQIITTLMGAISSLLPTIMEIATVIMSSLLPVITQIIEAVLPVAVTIIEAVLNMINALLPVITSLIEAVLPVVVSIITAIIDVINALLPIITQIIESVLPIITTAIQTVTGVIEGVVTVLTGVIDFITGVFSGDWDKAWQGIQKVADGIWKTISSVIEGAIQGVKDIIKGVLDTIKTIWNSMWNGIKSGISDIWSGIKTGVSNGINGMCDAIKGIKDTIVGFFSGAWQWLVDSGKSIIDGLVNGIKGAIGGAVDAVSGAVSKIRDLFPFSPAKKGPFSGRGWVLYSGISIMNALADGVEKRAGATVRTVKGVMQDVADATSLNATSNLAFAGGSLNGSTLQVDGLNSLQSSRDNRTINIALNYSASDNARTMFNDLVTRLETLDKVKG